MLAQLCRRALQLMDNFSAQGLSMLAWGLARLDFRDTELLAALPAAAKARARRCVCVCAAPYLTWKSVCMHCSFQTMSVSLVLPLLKAILFLHSSKQLCLLEQLG